MTLLRMMVFRLMALFQKDRLEQELDEEVRSHLEMLVEENMGKGMSPKEANCAALKSFGGLDQSKEAYRDQRGLPMVETFIQDLRYGLRMLGKNPGFTVVAVLTLALGIGANTGLFSIVNAVLLRPLPFRNADRLAVLYYSNPRLGFSGPGAVCDPYYVEWRKQNRVLEEMAAFHGQSLNLTGAGNPLRLQGAAVTASLFPLLGVNPVLGRTFLDQEEQPGHGDVVLISDELWQHRFGSDPLIVGKGVKLDGNAYTVIGIMPAGFDFPNQTRVWVPATFTNDCSNSILQVIGRLRDGATLKQAESEVHVISRRLAQESQRNDEGWEQTLVPLHELLVAHTRPALLILFGAVGLVLIIACANVANLMLARATTRRREMAIRASLGAGRRRLMVQLLTESLMLAFLGGLAGLLLVLVCQRTLISLVAQIQSSPAVLMLQTGPVSIDRWVFSFTCAISLIIGIFFGLAPSLQSTRLDLNATLKSGERGAGIGRHRTRGALVVTEVALALVVLVAAGLLIKSFRRLMGTQLGLDARNVITFNVLLPESRYTTAQQMKAFQQKVLAGIGGLPGVQTVGAIGFGLPLGDGGLFGDYTVEGHPPPSPELSASKPVVSPDYFQTMGIPLLRGREFTDNDDSSRAPVVIISQSLARQYWPHEDPIGRHINPGFSDSSWYSIVGVVGDVKQEGLSAKTPLVLYMPYLQAPRPFLLSFATFVVRTVSRPASIVPAVRYQVQAVDKEMPVFDVRTMEELVSRSVSQPRLNMLLFGSFALLAMLLAAVGIYGVVAYSVSERTQEIGVRIALGAQRNDVLKLIVGKGLGLALLGVGIGLASALSFSWVLSSLLFAVSPNDPETLGIVGVSLLAVAVIASYLPARRATRVDPVVALRCE